MEHSEFEEVFAAILALFPPLPEREQRVALALYRRLATGGPVSNNALAAASGIDRAHIARMVTLQQAWELGRRRNAQRYPMMQT